MKKVALFSTLLLLTACPGTNPIDRPVLVEKPELIVPGIQPVQQYGTEWIVVTKENIAAMIKDFDERGETLVLFAVTASGYQNIIMDMAELRRYIEQQNAIVLAYKDYYKKEEKKPETPANDKPWWKIW